MIGHELARELASAHFDGELDAEQLQRLEPHLAGCRACQRFANDLPRLRRAIEMMPRALPLGRPVRRPRARTRSTLASLAAASIVALVLVVMPPPTFDLPEAEAARALTRISTMYVERTVTRFDGDSREPASVLIEKIWFRAPGSVRIERSGFETDGPVDELVIEAPGQRYVRAHGRATFTENVPPTGTLLPEPLSTTVTAIGRRLGPGPVIAGRPTVRYEAEMDGERRVIYADAERFAAIGSEPIVILGKLATRTTKATHEVTYNQPFPERLFTFPQADERTSIEDGGFLPGAAFSGGIPRPRVPKGFRLIQEGTARDPTESSPTGYARFARGAMTILVTVGDYITEREPGSRTVTIAGTAGHVFTSLYESPVVEFGLGGKTIRVHADLPPDALVALASEMFGR